LLLTEVLGTVAGIVVARTTGDKMFALSTRLGRLYEINATTKVLVRDFDLTIDVPGYNKEVFASQIASSLAAKVFFGALIGNVGGEKTAALVKFDPTGDGDFTCYPMTGVDVPVVAVSADTAGFVYAATLHGSLSRLVESTGVFDAMYEPPSPGGVLNIVTFTNLNQPVLMDDGTFAFLGSKTRIINPANGDAVSTVSSSNVGTITGDALGYHHVKLTRINVPPSPIVPVIDSGKIDVFVQSDGKLTATGMPGALTNAVTVEFSIPAGPTIIGTVTPNSDGSFSITSSPGAGNPFGEPTQVKAVNGAQQTTATINSAPRNLPVGFEVAFQSSGFVLTGSVARLKAKLTQAAAITPSPGVLPIFRLKRDSDGKWFNGSIFVPDNGDYLQPSFDPDGEFWYVDVTIPVSETGSGSLVIKDSPPFSTNVIFLPEIASQGTLEEVLAIVNELNDKTDIAFGAPAGSFTDPATIGGFLFEKLNDIQKTVRRINAGIVGQRNVAIESIIIDVSKQAVAKGSTPSIDITIYDEERRFPLDISGAAVFFKAKINLASPVLLINRQAEIVDGPTGQARAKLTASDTATVQRVSAQIVADIPGTGILVSPAFFFDILDSVL
jgi:hypothetical protein